MSNSANDFCTKLLAFKDLGPWFLSTSKPVVIMIDNIAVTRFSQSKVNPPALSNASEFVVLLNFAIAHFTGKLNSTEELLNVVWMQILMENLFYIFAKTFPHNQMKIMLSQQADHNNTIFFHTNIFELPAEEQWWHRKPEKRYNAQLDHPVIRGSYSHKNDKHTDKMIYSMEPFDKLPRILF